MSIKIAILADVHGNSAALLAVLDELNKIPDLAHIYCLGDMVGIGYETNEVLDILFSRDDVSFVSGNHEEEIIAVIDGKEIASQGGERVHHEWLANRLDRRYISYIREMPKELVVEYEGKKLLFAHYHLNAERQFIPIDTDPTVEKLDELYKDSTFDLVCFGHHHPLHYFTSDKRTYLNPGSLGCFDRPVARYATVLITSEEITVQLKKATYKNQDFLSGYELLEVPEKDFILKVFHGNQYLIKE
ncbi:metallophosphoesterase family protein [Planococcus sp. APC 3906]|uniref:metallophosphoesterase family protein n=1 Tax=Planococcus sp. APC 3906 TaxID=3035194 RepID=UPI0025B60409|nr:metallophosphoesterase family protein [Planococcus sp. APC 3906]MDN3450365.1 metallophosphoesterase family protein [Planococcus sp. APC 3906]